MSAFVSVVLERGEIPESQASGPSVGKSFAGYFDDINATARALGLRPLSDFYVDYMEQLGATWADESLRAEDVEEATSRIGVDGPWFDADEGLRAVRGLIQHVTSSPAHGDDPERGPLTVLKGISSDLQYAKQQGSRFHFAFHE